MKLNVLALSALLALAAAETTTTAEKSATTTLSPEAECAKNCMSELFSSLPYRWMSVP